ncbi:hypothetical protein F0L74_05885 [Chitinophaga agrisoli]|uniref:Uncharacterized protein n=1 Tax=Chitinophaga agrisoli TaxID=2607653 RepID=A0A5B2W4K1_9BACT|nr:hypothetical protein [Chitinophaga agrisoli]KAA2245486.1 hypothetical protein F0L74_05885 [Chitinophaga agrisoli]
MQDILLDEEGDLLIIGADLMMGESTEQHQRLLLISNPGDFKETPAACVGAAIWLKDENTVGLLQEIKSEFEKDGMIITSVKMVDAKIEVHASYQTPSDIS